MVIEKVIGMVVANNDYVPERGDIVWLNFDPQQGKEIKKTRPAFVVTKRIYNEKVGLALFVPMTSKVKGYPFEVLIELENIKGVALCDQLRSLDWKARKASFVCSADDFIIDEILSKITVLIE